MWVFLKQELSLLPYTPPPIILMFCFATSVVMCVNMLEEADLRPQSAASMEPSVAYVEMRKLFYAVLCNDAPGPACSFIFI